MQHNQYKQIENTILDAANQYQPTPNTLKPLIIAEAVKKWLKGNTTEARQLILRNFIDFTCLAHYGIKQYVGLTNEKRFMIFLHSFNFKKNTYRKK